ncbi:MAG: YdcF family protein [Stellaceae bacterium]
MTFVASKLFWAIIAPGNLLLLLLLASLLWLARSRRRRGLAPAMLAALLLLTIAVLPVGQWAVAPLEQRFPIPAVPARLDGIIVLGGAVEPAISHAHGEIALNDAAGRITEALALARRHPEAKLLLTGGDASILPRAGGDEAGLMRTLFIALGVAPERLLVEDRSRNTFENAVLSRALAQPKPGEVWLIVTSARHMSRAVGCFRHVGWEVLPYPVDFRTEAGPRAGFSLAGHLGLLDAAAREWVGLVAYRLLGRIDTVFPAPLSEKGA